MAGEQKYFFLNMINANVHGGSTKANHIDWIELDNWDFSMNQRPTQTRKGGAHQNIGHRPLRVLDHS